MQCISSRIFYLKMDIENWSEWNILSTIIRPFLPSYIVVHSKSLFLLFLHVSSFYACYRSLTFIEIFPYSKSCLPRIIVKIDPYVSDDCICARFSSLSTECCVCYFKSLAMWCCFYGKLSKKCSSILCLRYDLSPQLICIVQRFDGVYTHTLAFAEIESTHAAGRLASLVGVEGGHALGTSLGVLRALYGLGARYLTLTHACNTPWWVTTQLWTAPESICMFKKFNNNSIPHVEWKLKYVRAFQSTYLVV